MFAVLGRGAVLAPGQPIPSDLSSAPSFTVDVAAMESPDALVTQLHEHWVHRTPVVIRLAVEPASLKAALREVEEREPWQVGPAFLFARQRLHFLVWNNNVDMRSGQPVWWWTKKAVALGATEYHDGTADVLLPDGTPAFCDGGPTGDAGFTTTTAVVPYIAIEQGVLRVASSRQSKATLAHDQFEAVHHRVGAARVIAPAGSGKTRVLTERLRHLLSDRNVAPRTLLAVAYNTRAAAELTERTNGLDAHIRTLNSLALAIVNGTGTFAQSKLEPRRREMLDERGVRNILQGMVELPRRLNADPLAAWIEALSAARLGLRSPRAIEEESGDLTGFADVFTRYRKHLSSHALLDFDEQIYRAIEILLQDPDARLVAQRHCRTLLVDEFQDLTPAHVLTLRLLASPALNVFGVGDDDQVIYGYAGANPAYLVDFQKWFPAATHHALEVNYRCPAEVVTAASNMLTRNAVRVPKNIQAAREPSERALVLAINRVTSSNMARGVLERITDWTADGCDPTQIAVLSRVNVTLLPVQVLLSEAGLAHTSPVNATLLDRTGIRTALAYIRIGLDPHNIQRSDIFETVRRPSRKIARNIVDLMTRDSTTSLAALRRLAASLTGGDGPRVAHYAEDIQAVVDAIQVGDTAQALEVIRTDIGLGQVMDVLDSSRAEADRSTHGDDLAAIQSVAHLHPDAASFEPWLRDVLNRPGNAGGVELSTVHRVKGREWDRVIVYDASAGLMPHRLSSDRAEERRILHVAMTRGRKRVNLFADNDRPSPFLEEFDAPGEPERVTPRTQTPPKTQSPAKTARLPAKLGMAISVPGGIDGEILDITDDSVILALGRARTPIAFGSMVRFESKTLELAKPLDEHTEQIMVALKAWRQTTASDAKVPAYTVLHDSHLEDIATSRPQTLAALAQCKGIGPAKLERWGDEILAIVETAQG